MNEVLKKKEKTADREVANLKAALKKMEGTDGALPLEDAEDAGAEPVDSQPTEVKTWL